jgi:hypothetical protein
MQKYAPNAAVIAAARTDHCEFRGWLVAITGLF